jgi:hypothetical protein
MSVPRRDEVSNPESGQLAEIIAESKSVIQAIEDKSVPLSRVALRGRRLAQMIGDDMNYVWLRLECEGVEVMTPLGGPMPSDDAIQRAFAKF